MIPRLLQARLRHALDRSPVVALLGPRQVGKTTLALELASKLTKPSIYLDLERDSDRAKLADAETYLTRHAGSLVILDEVQRHPELFTLLRSLVDERIRAGERTGQFLVLGSASRDLLQQTSESLAGRITYLQLDPISLTEFDAGGARGKVERLWLRGGFPRSLLAEDDAQSWDWRGDFIGTFLERDVPELGPRLPAVQARRLWTMLAHSQGEQLNMARLAASLALSGQTVGRYLDVLADLFMVRRLPPWSGSSRKRLVKAPKVYVRDSGLLHRLALIEDTEALLGHPLCGHSWEGFVIEQLLGVLTDRWQASFYRTSAQAEIDLVLEGPNRRVLAIEIKRTSAPTLSKGFLLGCEDIRATQRLVVIPAGEAFSLGQKAEAVPLAEMVTRLAP